jgi:hypothetical protein
MRTFACIIALAIILACAGVVEAQAQSYIDEIAQQDVPGEKDRIGYAAPSIEALVDPNEAEFKYLALDERGLSYVVACNQDIDYWAVCNFLIVSYSSTPQLVALSDFTLVSEYGELYNPSLDPLADEISSSMLWLPPDGIVVREGQSLQRSVAFIIDSLSAELWMIQIAPMTSVEAEPAYMIIEGWQDNK